VDEGDPLSLGPDARLLVYQPQLGVAASLQRRIEVVDSETDMVYPRPATGYEPSDRGVRRFGLEELHEGLARSEPGDPGAIGIGQGDPLQPQDIAAEGQQVVDGADRDPDMGDPRAASRFWHEAGALVRLIGKFNDHLRRTHRRLENSQWEKL
jgi:hypothetical protein